MVELVYIKDLAEALGGSYTYDEIEDVGRIDLETPTPSNSPSGNTGIGLYHILAAILAVILSAVVFVSLYNSRRTSETKSRRKVL